MRSLRHELWAIDVKTKDHTILAKDYQGKPLNAPNDVWVRPDGGTYITDPWYKRDYWTRGPQAQDGPRGADGCCQPMKEQVATQHRGQRVI